MDGLLLKNPRKRMQSTRRAEILKEFSAQLDTFDLVKVYCQEANDKVPRPDCKPDDVND